MRDAFGVERGDVAKKAPESHLDVNSLNTPEGLDRGIAQTDAVRRYHQKKAKHGAYAALGGAGVAGGSALAASRLPRAGMAGVVAGGALVLGGASHAQHHAVRADIARHNEAVMIGVKRQRAAVEEMAGAKPAAPTPTQFTAAKGLFTHSEENTRAQNVAYGAGTGAVGGALAGHYMDRKGLGLRPSYIHEGDPVKGFGRTTKAIARVSPKLAARGVLLSDKAVFHGKTPLALGTAAGVLGAAGGAMSQHRKKDIAKYTLPGDNPQAEAARERKKSGLGLAGVGYLVASRHKDVTPGAVDLITRPAKKGANGAKVAEREAKIIRRTKAINTLSSRGGAGMVGLGLGMAGEGLASDWRHRKVVQRAKGKLDDHMQAYRENRDKRENSVAKSAFGMGDIAKAFDPERQRHKRHELYEGGAAGGAVVGGAGTAVLGARAARAAGTAKVKAKASAGQQLGLHRWLAEASRPASPSTTTSDMTRKFVAATKAHRNQARSLKDAVSLTRQAQRYTRAGIGAGIGTAALAGTAIGIHRHDTTGHGRGY